MEYSETKNHFKLVRCMVGGRKLITVLCDDFICAEFDRPIKWVEFKQGLFIQPDTRKEDYNNRTYCFFNNNGEKVFSIKRKMNEDKTEFVENISVYEGDGSVSYIKTNINGDIVSKTFNLATNQEVVDGQLSLF